MTEGNRLYRENQGIIKARARAYAQTYQIAIEDVEGEANEIFCKALLSYDAERGVKFSTYLYSRLQSLNHYCKCLRSEWEQIEEIPEYLPTTINISRLILEESLTELSPVSRELVTGLIAGDKIISKKRRIKVNPNYISRELKCGIVKAEKIYNEISRWWRSIECYV